MSNEMIIQVHTLTYCISGTHDPMLINMIQRQMTTHITLALMRLITVNGVTPIDNADAGVATICAGDTRVVPINMAYAGTASINTADAGAALVNVEYPGVTHISTATQMKAPEVAVPAKVPGVVKKPSSIDMDE